MAATRSRRLALFDLDGTLTRHDTFVPFVVGLLARQPARWVRLLWLVTPLLAYAAGRLDRGGLKGAILHRLFGGMSHEAVASWSAHFATTSVSRRMHAAGVRQLHAHLAAGDHVVVLSASPDLYVPLLARQLGAHETHCTAIAWNGPQLDGRLAGPNRRDEEKARVLASLRSAHPGLAVIAYGNSEADLIHMRRCEEAVYVNAPAALQGRLRAEGIRCVSWN